MTRGTTMVLIHARRGCSWLILAFATIGTVAAQTSPQLLVLEKADRSMAIVDPVSLKVVARVPVGDDPHEVVVSPDGGTAFISNYGAFGTPLHTISVVDVAHRQALPPIDLAPLQTPHGLYAAHGKVYFTAELSKVVGRIDLLTGKVDWVLGTGQNRTHMVQVSRDENTIYTSNVLSNSISVIEADVSAQGWRETVIPVGKGPEGFDVSPDGKELWAANAQDGTVSVINLASKKVDQVLNVPTKRANRVKFTPDGRTVLISDLGTGDLVFVDAKARKEVKRLPLGKGCAGILVTPDGLRAFVAVSPDDRVAVIDLKTMVITGQIATGRGPDGMAWSAPRASRSGPT